MEIHLKSLPFDVDFHPSDSLVATGLINGYLLLYRYAGDTEPQRLLKVRAHKNSCRATRFIHEGRDCSILATDVETGSRIAHLENAHTAPINRIINLTEATIATGDDAGCVKV
ncbi:WD repeat-containing protein 55 [Bienertia sinuspersici]